MAPPAELALHINDLFYPQLAARLAADTLPRRLRISIENYRKSRLLLQEQLLARIRDHAAPGSGSLGEPIQALEAAAEQLRHELGSIRPGRPAQRFQSLATPAERAELMRAVAFHLDGLSRDQRRLLLTNADLLDSLQRTTPTGQRFVAPEGGSLAIPSGAPDDLAAAIASYTQEQQRILAELMEGLDTAAELDSRQAAAQLATIATAQTPAFAALERQADRIRVGLRPLYEREQSSTTPVPTDLEQRLAAYQDHKQELFREIFASLPRPNATAATPPAAPVAVPVSDFSPEQKRKFATLKAERDALRAEMVERRQQLGANASRKSIDDLLEEFAQARQTEELRQKYRNYHDALLRPDLSPAERRLLLDYALQALQLPLPTGEPVRQP